MDDTGEKVLYLCLEKAVDMEALAENTMPSDWEGVLEGEEPLNLYYPDKDKVCDVYLSCDVYLACHVSVLGLVLASGELGFVSESPVFAERFFVLRGKGVANPCACIYCIVLLFGVCSVERDLGRTAEVDLKSPGVVYRTKAPSWPWVPAPRVGNEVRSCLPLFSLSICRGFSGRACEVRQRRVPWACVCRKHAVGLAWVMKARENMHAMIWHTRNPGRMMGRFYSNVYPVR